MNYAKTIRIIRATTGLSQEQFAQRVSINPSLISRFENGKRIPTKTNILSISESFQVPIELIEILASENKNIGPENEKEQIGKMLLELLLNKHVGIGKK